MALYLNLRHYKTNAKRIRTYFMHVSTVQFIAVQALETSGVCVRTSTISAKMSMFF